MEEGVKFGSWGIEKLRASAFYADESHRLDYRRWWEATVGPQEPQSIDDRPAEALTTYTGSPEGGHQWIMEVRPGRSDWFLQPVAHMGSAIQLLDLAPDGLTTFHRSIRGWIESLDATVRRIAFGADLGLEVEDARLGFEGLQRYLPVGDDMYSPDAREFAFRINRPRLSSVVPDLRINRLAAWSLTELVHVHLTIDVGSIDAKRVPVTVQRLELDINSAADSDSAIIDPMALFDELITMGAELAREGDKP